MKIVFFGTPYIAAEILKKLIDAGLDIACLVTQPDRAAGRGKEIRFSPAKQVAVDNGISVLQPEKISDALDEIDAIGADLHVVAAYAQKLPNRLLEMAPLGCINVHPSLLPKYRGAAPMMAAILNGDEFSGVTIMKMAEKMDAGDILLQTRFKLDPDETNKSIEEKAIKAGGDLLLEAIEKIQNGSLKAQPQDESQATYIRQLKKESGLLDFGESADVIERKVRAFDPWPGTYTYLDGKTFKILKARVVPEEESEELCVSQCSAGEIAYVSKKRVMIRCGEGFLEPLEVQLEGKKRMSSEEFLRGKKIEPGIKLG